jgi:hypothetical protein
VQRDDEAGAVSPAFSLGDYAHCTRENMKQYQVINGTSYDTRTPKKVVAVLEEARLNRTRLHVSLGYTDGPKTGLDWLEENDVYGYIGRSTGPIRIPLLVNNQRSHGGPGLLDHCILRIRESAGGRVLYQHSAYHYGNLKICPKAKPVALPDGRILTVDVLRDGEVHAAFENIAQARRWVQKMGVVAPLAA